VVVLLVAPMLRRRRRPEPPDGDRGEVPARFASRWIVGLGVVLPAVLLVGVLVISVSTMRSISRAAPRGSTIIEVVGYQFWWAATYPDEGVTVANELHIPAGEPVELRITSADVIHSFWVPELHGKLDGLPETTNTLTIEADEPGVYGGVCAEFCGIQHANMGFLVIADEPSDYDAWLAGQQRQPAEPATEAARRGEALFAAESCARCHRIGDTTASEDGPDLTHVASRRTLAADTIENTTEQLTRWLRDPDAVKPGTTMPTPELSDEQIADLVAYVEGLE